VDVGYQYRPMRSASLRPNLLNCNNSGDQRSSFHSHRREDFCRNFHENTFHVFNARIRKLSVRESVCSK